MAFHENDNTEETIVSRNKKPRLDLNQIKKFSYYQNDSSTSQGTQEEEKEYENKDKDEENPNDSLMSDKEIKRVRAEIAWTEIGQRKLARKHLKGLVRNLDIVQSDSDEEEEGDDEEDDEEEESEDNEDEEEDEEKEDETISAQALVFLRELFKGADEGAIELKRQTYFDIIDQLYD